MPRCMSSCPAGHALAILLRIPLLGPLLGLTCPARAERHIWTVPGTPGIPYGGLLWDARSGTIIATLRNQVRRLDPLSGSSTLIGELRWESKEHRAGAEGEGPALDYPALAADGAVEVTAQDCNDHRLLRIGPDGSVRTVAGRIGTEWRFPGDSPDAAQAGFLATGLAVGPDGSRYLAAGDGRVYAATAVSRIWEFTPHEQDGRRCWRSRLIGSGEGTQAGDAIPARLALIDDCEFGNTSIHGLAAVPGGGLLVSTRHRGIRFIGPPPGPSGQSSDAHLAARVRDYRFHRSQGQVQPAQAIMAALLRQRDQRLPEANLAPFQALSKAGALTPALPQVLHRQIGSFILDHPVTRFRAALAIQATGDGHLYPPPAPAWAGATGPE